MRCNPETTPPLGEPIAAALNQRREMDPRSQESIGRADGGGRGAGVRVGERG
jgi:hypothetical protein